jgi:valyl-tRNA synthetase
MVRDEHGQKMSKTKGNVIDPLIVMDEYGTDALRFTLLVGSTPGNDLNLSINKVEANRNFANKLWNAGRYVISILDKIPDQPSPKQEWTPADEYIHARMRQTVRDVNRLFESYQFGEAGRQIYDFFWTEFADWYIEASKQQIREGGGRAFYTAWTLIRVLDKCLRLLHPYTPFVTEELWGHLRKTVERKSSALTPEDGWGIALMKAKWPESKEEEDWEADAVEQFIKGAIEPTSAFRALKTSINIPVGQKMNGSIISTPEYKKLINQSSSYIKELAKLNDLIILDKIPTSGEYKNYASESISSTGSIIYLRTDDQLSSEEMKDNLEKELKEAQSHINRLKNLLASEFSKKAPEAVVMKEKEKLQAYEETARKIKIQFNSIE